MNQVENIGDLSGTDPIHREDDGKWYFWDETGSDAHGPYNTEEEAKEALSIYVRYCL